MTTMAAILGGCIDDAGWVDAPAGDPVDAPAYLALLRHLYHTGRRDLPAGRLLEGHVDAVQIVLRYGSPDQVERFRARLADGATAGVWNAGLPGEPLVLADDRLGGGKSYASGAGVLSHALVNADTDRGPQLLLLDLARVPPTIDRSWWKTLGMQRSETHQVRWSDVPIAADDAIGEPGSYAREPFFSGGALRFVAVHAGGIAGVLDAVRDHLVATGRADDPFQAARIAELFSLAESTAATVRHTAQVWFDEPDSARLARVAAARLQVATAGERALAVAQEAVGLQGLFLAHPLAARLADLMVYLRQPAPDAQRLKVGRAVAAGDLDAAL
ncbi:acyl-CoA dehydrogenase [Sphingomonas sp. Tas61C01]|uniref:acyl-CoA dehydrogenase n=1 Tax=Sphingomonas sp. Tas61C01 TaxID=3458297 RepID=UPI00403EA6C4